MDTTTFIDPAVVGWITKNVIFTKVYGKNDDGSRTAFTDSAGVRGFPTYVLLNSDGTEIDRAVGAMPSQEFITTFTDFKNGKNTLGDFLSRVEKEPTAEINYEIANKYRWRGKTQKAEEYFQRVIKLDPNDEKGFTVESGYALADMARRDYHYDLAIKRFQHLIETYPESKYLPEFHIYQAICYKDAGKLQPAIDKFAEYIKRFPQGEDVEYAQGKIESLKEELHAQGADSLNSR